VIGIIMFGVGIIMMIAMRVAGTPFWDERAGVVDPDLVPASEGGTAP
jgi:hypothetical protein